MGVYAIDNQGNTMPTIFIQKGYKINNVGNKNRKNENVVSLLLICRQDNILEIREIHRIAYKTTKISSFSRFFPLSANSEELTKQKY
jgi:hypothetical protein